MNNNLIPEFIARKFKEGRSQGRFNAISMFVDLAGFTRMTEKLIDYGKPGAETLSDIIYQVFEPAIDSIYIHKGWISTFAGDAFTALFRDDSVEPALSAAFEMKESLQSLKIKTEFGDFLPGIRIGVSCGEVNWGIIKNEKQNAYYFRGKAIDRCSSAEHLCKPGEIVISEDILDRVKGKIITEKKKEGYRSAMELKKKGINIDNFTGINISENIVKEFVPESILSLKVMGEFRNISSVFISFKEDVKLEDFLNVIINKTSEYGGFFNKVDFGDKGGIALVLFGAPRGIENQMIRSLKYAVEVRDRFSEDKSLRIGISNGRAYTGIVGGSCRIEYTALGEVVNISARLAMKSEFGEISTDEKIMHENKNLFKFKFRERSNLKGLEERVNVYITGDRKSITQKIFTGKIFGRKEQIRKIRNYIKEIDDGKFGGIVYVDGAPGIGKSRLINKLKTGLDREQYNWFYLPCDGILNKSFHPLRTFARNYFGFDSTENRDYNKDKFSNKLKRIIRKTDDEEIKSELRRTKSIFAAMLDIYMEDSLYENLDAKGIHENTIFSFKNLIKAESLQKPTIVEVEDGQWIDGESLEFLRILTRNVENYPFIIITSCRLRDDGSVFRFGLENVKTRDIHLDNLGEKEIRSMLEDRLGGKVSLKLLDIIGKKSEGNPFYVEQMAMHLKESNSLELREEKYILKGKNIEMPGKISSVILARIDRLEEDLKQLVKAASVLGRQFSSLILDTMISVKEIGQYLVKGEKEAIWSSINDLIYIFKHALIQDIAYRMQLERNLKNLHKLAGEAIEKIYGSDKKSYYEELAYHFEKAEIKKKAIEFLEKGGNYLSSRYENEKALDFYRRLLKLIKDREKIISINNSRAKIYRIIGKWKKAEGLLRENVRESQSAGNKILEGDSKYQLSILLLTRGDFNSSLDIAEDAINIFKECGDKKKETLALEVKGDAYLRMAEYNSALKIYHRLLKVYRSREDKERISTVLGDIGIIYVDRGMYSEGMSYYKEQLKIAREMDNKRDLSAVTGNIGGVYYTRGEYEKALEYYREKLQIAGELGDRRGIAIARGNIGVVNYRLGNFEVAMDNFKKHLEIAGELGDKYSEEVASGNIGNIYMRLRDYDKACKYYKRDLSIAEELNDKFGIAQGKGHLGYIFCEKGKFKKARKMFEESLKISRELDSKQCLSKAIFNMGYLEEMRGNYEKARKYYDTVCDITDEFNLKYQQCETLYRKACLGHKMADMDEAEKNLKEAFRVTRTIKRKDLLFWCKLLEIKLLSKRNKKEAILRLVNMLNEYKRDFELAEIYFLRHKISGDSGEDALKLCRKIFKRTESIRYRWMIKELDKEVNGKHYTGK